MKPFIHLFQTLEQEYLYDVNKNSYTPISTELYSYLKNILKDEDLSFEATKSIKFEMEDLKSKGYLSINRVNSIEHPATENLDDYISRKLKILTIQLTHDCNLRCSYCPYTSNDGSYRLHKKKSINFDSIKKALEILRDNSVDSESITIGFYGGEPLLEFNLLKETVDLSRKLFIGKSINYTITTNGTLLTEDVLKFLQANDFQVVISLDGPQKINDANRKFAYGSKSVYEVVVEKVKHIHKHYPNLKKKLGLNMVMDPTQSFKGYCDFFDELPVLNDMMVSATVVDDEGKLEKYNYSKSFRNESRYAKFLTYLNVFNEIDIDDQPFYKIVFNGTIQKNMEKLSSQKTLGEKFCPSGPCIPGHHRLMVNVEGVFYPCERVSEENDFNCIGDVNTGFNIERASSILNVAQEIEYKCKDCFAFRNCSLCVKGHECRLKDDNMMEEKCRDVRWNFHYDLISNATIHEILES